MGQPDGDFSAIDVVAMLYFGVLNYDAKQEGANWEAAMSAGHRRLENLTLIVDPNRLPALLALLTASPKGRGKPLCIIANTTKGKGVSFMENKAA